LNTNNMFWSLVKHDLKNRKRQNARISKTWKLVYLALGAIIALAMATYVSLGEKIVLADEFWYMTIGVAFAVFGMAIGFTKHEWKNGTVGWWLTLPMPRIQLVTSKFLASVIRGIGLFAALYGIIAVVTVYVLLISHNFHLDALLHFLGYGLKVYFVVLLLSPFVASFGVLYAIFGESKARPLLPIVWVAWVGIWIFNSQLFHISGDSVGRMFDAPLMLTIPIVVSWVLSYVMLKFSAYVLDRHMTN
jgi:ABC-2 type transport system permease protein